MHGHGLWHLDLRGEGFKPEHGAKLSKRQREAVEKPSKLSLIFFFLIQNNAHFQKPGAMADVGGKEAAAKDPRARLRRLHEVHSINMPACVLLDRAMHGGGRLADRSWVLWVQACEKNEWAM